MPDLLVRNLSDRALRRLKAKAKESGRSLQGEAKEILERAAAEKTVADRRAILEKVRRQFAGRQFDDSAALIREDRER